MWWALFWGIAIGVVNAWAGLFAFLLSLAWQEHNRLEKIILDLHQKKKYAEDEAEALRQEINRQPKKVTLPDPASPDYEAHMDYLRDRELI